MPSDYDTWLNTDPRGPLHRCIECGYDYYGYSDTDECEDCYHERLKEEWNAKGITHD